MGVTYGAHGVWSFHRHGMNFLNKKRAFEPYDWDVALELDGGWDVSFARWIFETYRLFDLNPANIVLNDDPEIRVATNADTTKVAIYSPYSFDIELEIDLKIVCVPRWMTRADICQRLTCGHEPVPHLVALLQILRLLDSCL